MALGNTRPLEPTNVACPSASHHARSAAGGKRLDRRPEPRLGRAVAAEQRSQVFAVREVEPAAPREQELAPERRHRRHRP